METLTEKLKNELAKLAVPFVDTGTGGLYIPQQNPVHFAGIYVENGHYVIGYSKNWRWKIDTFHEVYKTGDLVSEMARFYYEETDF